MMGKILPQDSLASSSRPSADRAFPRCSRHERIQRCVTRIRSNFNMAGFASPGVVGSFSYFGSTIDSSSAYLPCERKSSTTFSGSHFFAVAITLAKAARLLAFFCFNHYHCEHCE